jgi:hypothetical protein
MKVTNLKKQVEENFESSKLEERDVESIRKSCHSTLQQSRRLASVY